MDIPARLAWALLLAPALMRADGWTSTGPWGGAATSLWVDAREPDTLLAGARNSLLYRSLDAGAHWQRLSFPRHFAATLSAVAVHPLEPRLYLAGATLDHSPFAGLWLSEDAGASWQQAPELAGHSVQALAFFAADARTVVAATRDGVWRSRDSGRHWQRISAPWNHELRSVTAVAIDPRDPDIIYAGTTHLPWRTRDGGQSWQSMHEGMLDDSDVFSIAVDARPGHALLASACSGIYRSDNGGDSWTRFQTIPSSHRRTHAILRDARDATTLYAGTTIGLLKSTDDGATFRQLNAVAINAMALDPVRGRLYLASESGLWRSDDGGAHLVALNHGFAAIQAGPLVDNGEGVLYLKVHCNGARGTLFTSRDQGRTWIALPTRGGAEPPEPLPTANALQSRDQQAAARPGANVRAQPAAILDPAFVSSFAACGRLVLAAAGPDLFFSSDSAQHWQPAAAGPAPITSLACLTAKGRQLGFAGSARGLWRGSTGGAWQPVASVSGEVSALFGGPASGARIAAVTAGRLHISTDSGATWQHHEAPVPTTEIADLLFHGSASDILLATSRGLLASTDGGRSWMPRTDGFSPGSVDSLAAQPGTPLIWATQFGHLFYSPDGGVHWKGSALAATLDSSIRRLIPGPPASPSLVGLTAGLGVFRLDLPILQGDNPDRGDCKE